MFENHVLPRIENLAGDTRFATRVLRVSGMGESAVDEKIAPIYAKYENPQTTILFNSSEIEIHLRAHGRTEADADALLDEGSFVIFNRPEIVLAPETLRELGFVPARSRIVHLDTPAIAAHQVRDRVARGAPIDDLVPAAVADYIRTHELYQV